MQSPVIISQVNKSFGSVAALHGITMEVQRGELFGLIGPDGAGKTTLFRIMTSLMVPDSGTATVLGYDVVKDYKKIRSKIGYMPGKFSLYQDLTVTENLQFFATIFGTTIHENYELIREIYVQIEPFKKRRAGKLSGGMKQKLALCCALIHAPEVLFLDEPTTGVDPVSRKEFWEMLQRLKQKQITIVVSTPYMDEAARCDRMALIQNGSLLRIDTPSKSIAGFGKTLLQVTAPDKPKLIRDLRNYPFAASVFPFGESIHYTDTRVNLNEEMIKALEDYLASCGQESFTVSRTTPSVEDVFMQLMQQETTT